jgi:hypothetical protein
MGAIPPDAVVTPSALVHHLIGAAVNEKTIMAKRAAMELHNGTLVIWAFVCRRSLPDTCHRTSRCSFNLRMA